MEIRNLDFSFENKDGNHLTGLIQTNKSSHILGNEKKWREVISPYVFSKAISRAFENNRDIDFISDHDDSKILASTKNDSLTLKEDEDGLHISANVIDTSWAKDVLELVKSGIITGLSFGMTVNSQRWSKCNDGIDLRIIDDIDLFEISAVRNPAYPLTNLENRGINVTEDIELPKEKKNMEEFKVINEQLQKIIDMLSPQNRVEDKDKKEKRKEEENKEEKNPEKDSLDNKENIKSFLKETLMDIMKDIKNQDKVDDIKEEIQEEVVENRKNEASEIQKEVDEKVKEDQPNTDKQEKVIVGTAEEPVKEKTKEKEEREKEEKNENSKDKKESDKETRSANKEDLEDLKEFFK